MCFYVFTRYVGHAFQPAAGLWPGARVSGTIRNAGQKPGGRLESLTLRCKPIAFSTNRVNVPGIVCVVFDLLPQPRNVHVERTRGSLAGIRPYLTQNFLSRYHGAAALHQVVQQLELLQSEV